MLHANIHKGLDRGKCKKLWYLMKLENIMLGFFTETGILAMDDGHACKPFPGFKYKIYNPNVNNNVNNVNTIEGQNILANGVMVVWNSSFFQDDEIIVKTHKDHNSRYNGNILSWLNNSDNVVIFCIYAPTSNREQRAFYNRVFGLIDKQVNRKVVVVGDLNINLNMHHRISELLPNNLYCSIASEIQWEFANRDLTDVADLFSSLEKPTRVHHNNTQTRLNYWLLRKMDKWDIDLYCDMPVILTGSDHNGSIVQMNVASGNMTEHFDMLDKATLTKTLCKSSRIYWNLVQTNTNIPSNSLITNGLFLQKKKCWWRIPFQKSQKTY